MSLWRFDRYSIKQKNKLHLKFKKVNSALNDELYESFKIIWKWLNNIIIMICLLSIITFWKKNLGITKSIINKSLKSHILDRENLITPGYKLVSLKFNDLDINIGPTLAKSIPHVNKSYLRYLGNRLTESITWPQWMKMKRRNG